MRYETGTLNREAFAEITGKLKALISAAYEHGHTVVPVDVYDLDAMLDQSEMRKRTMDYYAKALYEEIL